jgi:hypothetical protein
MVVEKTNFNSEPDFATALKDVSADKIRSVPGEHVYFLHPEQLKEYNYKLDLWAYYNKPWYRRIFKRRPKRQKDKP